MDKHKVTGLVGAVLAALLLTWAAFSSSWIIGNDFGIKSKVGLRSIDVCVEGSCDTVQLSEYADSPFAPDGLSTFITFGKISFVLALAAALAMLVLLGYGASGKTPRWPVHPGSIGLLLSIGLLFAGVLTLALHPFKGVGWGTGPGFMLLAAGDVAALVASLMLGRSKEPTVDDWFE